jgi:hypothetical protein
MQDMAERIPVIGVMGIKKQKLPLNIVLKVGEALEKEP